MMSLQGTQGPQSTLPFHLDPERSLPTPVLPSPLSPPPRRPPEKAGPSVDPVEGVWPWLQVPTPRHGTECLLTAAELSVCCVHHPSVSPLHAKVHNAVLFAAVHQACRPAPALN